MRVVEQQLDEIVAGLSPLQVEWMDPMAANAIAKLTALEVKSEYTLDDVAALLNGNFDEGVLCCRLFLGLSGDGFDSALRDAIGGGPIGVKRYQAEPEAYLKALDDLGLPEAMSVAVNHVPVWSDILVERLRSGRGSAISGQKRGRGLEDFVEAVVEEVFGKKGYVLRCSFSGVAGKSAKCDIAIPNKTKPLILIEIKAYGSTGSKMTDVIGDVDAIIEAKRRDAAFLLVTDGIAWKDRLSDLAKIVERQADGRILRIYTMQMRDQFLADLITLKAEYDI